MARLVATMKVSSVTDFIYQWIDAPVVMSDLGTGNFIEMFNKTSIHFNLLSSSLKFHINGVLFHLGMWNETSET